MAIILIHVVYGRVEGISVDTHVHRISNELGWTGAAGTKQPEQTRKALESWMPKEVWGFVNLILVGFGQELQTQKPKLLRKVLRSSDPTEALRIVEVPF